MSISRKMTAGLAGSSKHIHLNGDVGGGNKLQGIAPTNGRTYNTRYDRSYGNERNTVFNLNQLGGVGRFRTMFITGADGVIKKKSDVNTSIITNYEIDNGILLLTIGSSTTGAWSKNGGSRMFLVEFDKDKSETTSSSVLSDSYFLKSEGGYSFNPYTKVNTSLGYKTNKKSRSPDNISSLKYVTIDCSDEVTIKNTVNISLTRPGIVTTSYLVPANTANPVHGSNGSGLSGSIMNDGSTYGKLYNALQDSNGDISDDLIAQYGLGYNDAQGLATGYSIEIDLFEMTPCSLATTLHGAINGSTIETDTDGAWCNIHGTYGYTEYSETITTSGSKFPAGTGANKDTSNNYVSYILTINDDELPEIPLNKYGPGEDFYINTLKDITITNNIIGCKSLKMPDIWAEAIDSVSEYDENDGWLQMTTIIEQTKENGDKVAITIKILSQGFKEDTNIKQMNYVTSIWTDGNLTWLDGNINSSEVVPRGWVSYSGGATLDATKRANIISDDVYNNLNTVYKNAATYSELMNSEGGTLNPSISLLGGLTITSLDTDTKYHGYTMDIMYRGINDYAFPAVNWTGQYALSYGVHYASSASINNFSTSTLINVPPVIINGNGNNKVSDNNNNLINHAYYDYVTNNIWSSPNIDPGSFLTGNSVSNPGIFSIPSNQLVYSPLSSYIDNDYNNDEDILKKIMPLDGANYISFF